ncbi:ATP-binding protein [Algivirga pacifica]|uniref:AAA+ ATPase domain-containing protein n=1 Tax=Algivirga pacifica TaxID=1162670 RepID=A0ABP9D5M3_9BACT
MTHLDLQIKAEEGTMIQAIETVEASIRENFDQLDNLLQEEKSITLLAEQLGCSPIEAVYFSAIFTLNFHHEEVYMKDLAEFFDCDTIRLAGHLKVLDKLIERRLVRKYQGGHMIRRYKTQRGSDRISGVGYYITRDILDKVLNDKLERTKESQKQLSLIAFLEKVEELMEEREEEEICYAEMRREVMHLLTENKELHICKQLNSLHLDDMEIFLVLYLCFETVSGHAEIDIERMASHIFEDLNHRFLFKKILLKGTAKVYEMELIKLEDGVFRNDREVMLTDKGVELFFGEDAEMVKVESIKKSLNNLIKPQDIKVQEIIYNQREHKQLSKLQSFLEEERLRQIQQRLEEHQMQKGFSVLLYGEPGTGKTATVYDLALKTGRPLYKVDASDFKSMWHGESEKKLKKVFSNYRDFIKHCEVQPIIFLNEADGILSRRIDVNHAIDQTSNALQNILLQELEDLDGILIATTNLADNLDTAFERRFLYKVKFDLPTEEVRTAIWKAKIKGLSEDAVTTLGREYPFTGGQIDNVARKYIMNSILEGEMPTLKELKEYCEYERLHKETKRQVGFAR